MSKHETKMTRWYAKTRYPKGFLLEEYLALPQGKTNGKRLMEVVIVIGLNAELRGQRKERRELARRHLYLNALV